MDAVVPDETKPKVPMHKDGIYFGLNEDAYHADPALGSTDMKKLRYEPADYWFESAYNPMHDPGDDSAKSPALIKGKAVHKFVLEGRAAFESEYAPCDYGANLKAGKEERLVIAEAGMTPLMRVDYDRIMQAGTMIRANPELANAFSGGYSEVSVFWTDDGIRKKARFDYLKLRSTVDLKSITNTLGIEFARTCINALGNRGYLMQAAHYCEGRASMRHLLSSVHVADDHPQVDHDWLAGVAYNEPFAFTFVFWQASGAPVTWGTYLTYPDNPIFDVAKRELRMAEDAFRACSERFAPGEPWVNAAPLAELDVNDMPAWWFR